MATRYWVGGSGIWNNSSTSRWSASSGGSAGASAPTISDDVVFDNNSFAVGETTATVTVSSDVSCQNLSIVHSTSGNIVDIVNTTNNLSVYKEILANNQGWKLSKLNLYGVYRNNATSNGYGCSNITVLPGGTAYAIISSSTLNTTFTLDVRATITLSAGSNASISYLKTSNSATFILLQNTTLLGNADIDSGANVSTGSYKLIINPLGSSDVTLTVNGTLGNLDLGVSSSGLNIIFKGSGTIQNFTESTSSSCNLKFDTTSDLKFAAWSVSGVSGNTLNVSSTVDGVRAKITKSTAGIVSTNYLQVRDMQPYPDNTWISYNSTNLGNNYQWYFDSFTKPTSCLFFGSHI